MRWVGKLMIWSSFFFFFFCLSSRKLFTFVSEPEATAECRPAGVSLLRCCASAGASVPGHSPRDAIFILFLYIFFLSLPSGFYRCAIEEVDLK